MSVSPLVLLSLLLYSINVSATGTRDSRILLPHSYEVSIRFVGRHFCVGAIISSRHILTAAHCFYQNSRKFPDPIYKYMSVVSGFNANLSDGGFSHKIRNVTTHEDLINATHEYWVSDIALVTLENEISYSPLQQPVDLAESDLSDTARAKMSIWNSPVESLEIVEVYFISHGKCAERLREKFLGEHDKKICGYTRAGRGFCLKNDGSPLVQNGKLIGIASKSEGCKNGNPDVYTNVHRNIDFINRAIALNDNRKISIF